MTIKVKYFASLQESFGRAEESVELENDITTVAELWQRLTGKDSGLPDNVLTAINMEYVKADARIKDGDEVAFFPPVTGG
ncbi:MAG: molybdopterin converting factor subunit 1 [Gammaproteobacteria bacterium]|nr:molybdopterin converting factor subunit 1 [Gammaproteobacteria bacterium]NIN61531.1 molybdopterin converting factor subunit 1 [Gammaproteobacteria bacterium]NIO62725.1 molybdopterin converting factor subunit 1 [Gammaproteobacteria bacterium]NIQ09635.1 molybdopterin converting factor subunit 1 [Gammaproteobacteria bacterium]NIQ19289.1 molybdopterin converting factor subunit 1 [Gammaproteobacteria bacterium]